MKRSGSRHVVYVSLVGVASTSAFTLLVPVFGVLGSVLVLGEPLCRPLAAGGALVIAGLWFAHRPMTGGVRRYRE
jgi:drug/metabolite transporter (DMT)-like permease